MTKYEALTHENEALRKALKRRDNRINRLKRQLDEHHLTLLSRKRRKIIALQGEYIEALKQRIEELGGSYEDLVNLDPRMKKRAEFTRRGRPRRVRT